MPNGMSSRMNTRSFSSISSPTAIPIVIVSLSADQMLIRNDLIKDNYRLRAEWSSLVTDHQLHTREIYGYNDPFEIELLREENQTLQSSIEKLKQIQLDRERLQLKGNHKPVGMDELISEDTDTSAGIDCLKLTVQQLSQIDQQLSPSIADLERLFLQFKQEIDLKNEKNKFIVALQGVTSHYNLDDPSNGLSAATAKNMHRLSQLGGSGFCFIWEDVDSDDQIQFKLHTLLTKISTMTPACRSAFDYRFGPAFLSDISTFLSEKVASSSIPVLDDDVKSDIEDWWTNIYYLPRSRNWYQ